MGNESKNKPINEIVDKEIKNFRENLETMLTEKPENFSAYMEALNRAMTVESSATASDEKTNSASENMVEMMTLYLKLIEKISIDIKLKNNASDKISTNDEIQKAIEEAVKKSLTPKEIETLKSILPESYYIANNKLANEMTKEFLNKGAIPLAVIKPNKKGEVVTYNSLSLTYDSDKVRISGREKFTAYDRAVHNAVCSLYVAGNKVFTPAMVYRTLNGMTDTEYVSSNAIEAVVNSLDKSRFTRLRVDFSDEARARGLTDVKKAEIDSYLLPAEVVTIEAGGHHVAAYKILDVPVLYQYAHLTSQVISIPLSLMDTSEAARNSEDIIPIKEYLLRRIEIMKHEKDMSNKIVYDTIFEEVGIVIKHNTERDRIRKYITSILSLWKTRDNYIKDFQEYKEGKSIKGIKIIY